MPSTAYKPIPKARFDRMTVHQQRVAVAKDLIARLDLKLITGFHGNTWANLFSVVPEHATDKATQKALNTTKRACEVCAKGALLATWVGLFDSVPASRLCRFNLDYDNGPEGLRGAFSRRLLSALETAFECEHYSWNVGPLEVGEASALMSAFRDTPEGDERLRAVYTNLISNEGKLVIKGVDGETLTFD